MNDDPRGIDSSLVGVAQLRPGEPGERGTVAIRNETPRALDVSDGATIALAVIQVGLIIALHMRHHPAGDLTSFQVLMISMAATALVFGSLVREQQTAAARLRSQQMALSRALRLRSMGEIASTIAHEVNQPITSIKTFAGAGLRAFTGIAAMNVSVFWISFGIGVPSGLLASLIVANYRHREL